MKIHGGPYQMSGVPDVLCVKHGVAVFLEVKKPGEKPTEIQKARMDEIRRVGGASCAVVTSKEEAMSALHSPPAGTLRTAMASMKAEQR